MREILMATILSTTAVFSSEPVAMQATNSDGTVLKYRLSSPESLEPGKTYPLVLFLHGAGERGDDNSAQLKHGVIPIIEGAKKLGDPCFLIAPQCPADRWWSPINRETMRLSAAGKPNPLMEAVITLVSDMMKTHPVDPKRLYVTGISMGGYATWDLLVRAHEKIAAAVPICGGGDPSQATAFKDIPVHAFHGELDSAVPVRSTREMITAMQQAGGKPLATFYPDLNHDSWTRTYNDPALIRWIFQQRKP